jgi:hypothetical protein
MFLEFLLVDILALLLTLRVALNVGSNASARILAANGGTEFPICFRTSVIEPTNSNSSGEQKSRARSLFVNGRGSS